MRLSVRTIEAGVSFFACCLLAAPSRARPMYGSTGRGAGLESQTYARVEADRASVRAQVATAHFAIAGAVVVNR